MPPKYLIELGKTAKKERYKTYLTDYPGAKWVVLGRWANSPSSLQMPKQPEYLTPEEAWQFARDLFIEFPDAVGKPTKYMSLVDRTPSGEDPQLFHDTRVAISTFTITNVINIAQKEDISNDDLPLYDENRDVKSYLQKSRPFQDHFQKSVFLQYGEKCAFCSIKELNLLDAAHIVPWINKGADIPGNGLVLCALHHRAFDTRLVRIEPETTTLVVRDVGPTLDDLHIEEIDLKRLRILPRPDALADRWLLDAEIEFGAKVK